MMFSSELVVFVLLSLYVPATEGYYTCLCSYLVETNIYSSPDTNSNVDGYMYEFDCKPVYQVDGINGFEAIGNEHKLGYIETNSQIQIQTCQGDIQPIDIVPSTTPPPTTTTPMTTTTTTPIPTTTSPTTTTTEPTTTTTVTTTPKPTTITTTPKPTTITTTPKPTPKPTTITTTPKPTPKPPTTTTTPKPATVTTTPSTTVTTTKRPTAIPIRISPPSGCPQNLDPKTVLMNGLYCYELVRQKDTWKRANDKCVGKGGTLVTIETESKQHFIYSMLEKLSFFEPIWIGLHDQVDEQWEWVTGSALVYKNWMPGRYIDQYHQTEDCALFVFGRGGEWDDQFCDGIIFEQYKSFPYICQYHHIRG